MIYLFPTFPMRSEQFDATHLPGLPEMLAQYRQRAINAVGLDPQILYSFQSNSRETTEQTTVQLHYACITESVAMARWLTAHAGPCTLACSYSMGLFAAAAHAGTLDFETALQLCRDVCDLAHQGAPEGPWFIGAVVDFPHARLRELIAASSDPLEVTDRYGPQTLLYTGRRAAVKAVLDRALAEGAPLTRLIPITTPFHTSHLRPLEPTLKRRLEQLAMRDPAFPLLSPITQELLRTADDIRAEFARNISRPMDWTATMQRLLTQGPARAVEAGASTTLTELGRAAFPGCVYSDFRDLQQVAA